MSNKVYGKSDHRIGAVVGEAFGIDLDTNPTTGYEWQLHIDGSLLRLKERRLRLPRLPAEGLADVEAVPLGAGGTEQFTFKPLAEGETSILFEYRRPWESESLEKIQFTVRITAVNG